jgi:hypothetical protein
MPSIGAPTALITSSSAEKPGANSCVSRDRPAATNCLTKLMPMPPGRKKNSASGLVARICASSAA